MYCMWVVNKNTDSRLPNHFHDADCIVCDMFAADPSPAPWTHITNHLADLTMRMVCEVLADLFLFIWIIIGNLILPPHYSCPLPSGARQTLEQSAAPWLWAQQGRCYYYVGEPKTVLLQAPLLQKIHRITWKGAICNNEFWQPLSSLISGPAPEPASANPKSPLGKRSQCPA